MGNREPQSHSIELWQYDNQRKRWSPKHENRNDQINSLESFRVLTFNVWFSNEHQTTRFNSLCEILKNSNAQIIGLQEVTEKILQQLLTQPVVQERYYLSDIDGRTFEGWYGVVLLIDNRLHVSKLKLVNFPHSNMGRRLIFAEIQLDEQEVLRIGTVHLESLDNAQQRSHQIDICHNALKRDSGSCILMGDFNFSAVGQENIDHFNKLRRWIDVWAHLMGPDNLGYTFDTETNSMSKRYNGGIEQCRYDRIILSSETIIPRQIQIIGNQPIASQGFFSIFPSDHYGLTAVFQKRK